MTFAEIQALPSVSARIEAYNEFVEDHPDHPVAWFNLAVECEAAREYKSVRAAAEKLRRLNAELFASLPDPVLKLLGVERVSRSLSGEEVSGYRIAGIAAATESVIYYDAVRAADQVPATLWHVLDLTHDHARHSFQLALAAPRVEGLARPLELIEHPERGPLLVLERIHGEPLHGDPRVQLDVEIALRLIRCAAETVRGLHHAGALHGDLRPDLVLRDRAHECATVLVGGRRAGVAPRPLGRAPWRSPEEAAGGVPSPATDVYGLGLLLHHILTGAEPAPLGERAPIHAASGWPELDELIARATARDPRARPDIEALSHELDQLLSRHDVPPVIGPWRIGRLLGEGSFGRVFAAENVGISSLRAAVKVLHPALASARELRRRFINEAEAASQIDHPRVVKILGGGVEPDGTCYIAMELLKGSDLGHLLAHGGIERRTAVRLIRDAASALACAHEQHIIHRDIKPSNLFVTQGADGAHIRILDFGIALLRGEPTREGIPYTATGYFLGTPAYMAPEQWQMRRDLDGRVDIYSLGLVLWECIAGRPPFAASTPYEWQQAHLAEPLPRLRDLGPPVPPRLEALLERMSAKDREQRMSTMTDVVAELDAILSGWEEPPPPPPWWRRWTRGAAVLAAMLAAVGTSLVLARACAGSPPPSGSLDASVPEPPDAGPPADARPDAAPHDPPDPPRPPRPQRLDLHDGWVHGPGRTQRAAFSVIEGTLHFQGAIAQGTTSAVFRLPRRARPAADVYLPVGLCAARAGRLLVHPSGEVLVQVSGGGALADAACFVSLDGVGFDLSADGFQPLALRNDWRSAPNGTRRAEVTNDAGTIRFKGGLDRGQARELFTLPSRFRPPADVFVPVDLCQARNGRLQIQPSGRVRVYGERSFADAQCFVSLEGVTFAASARGYVPLALEGRWRHAPQGTRRAMVTADRGIVRFQGAIASGKSARLFTLPMGYRPSAEVYVAVDLCAVNRGRLRIRPSGDVDLQGPPQLFTDPACIVSLEGAWFAQ